ncbi:hypothetical protein GH714_012114 [Hevea brasiliensis]|uniref:EF-hand domain-containing protein n=1 Tax=Hevea brasiliensis TaxID=3981 RepID=A0A6A6LJX4_HEVBR|nr:hypothetical protein GH714_012114 [Hevea brasiliensis]
MTTISTFNSHFPSESTSSENASIASALEYLQGDPRPSQEPDEIIEVVNKYGEALQRFLLFLLAIFHFLKSLVVAVLRGAKKFLWWPESTNSNQRRNFEESGKKIAQSLELRSPNSFSHPIQVLDQEAVLTRFYCNSDKDGDGKLSRQELKECLRSLCDLHKYHEHDQVDKFLEIDGDGKIEISQIVKESENVPFLQAAKRAILEKALDCMIVEGQAVPFIAVARSSASPSVLYVIVVATAVAFLFLGLSFWFEGRKNESAARITGAIGALTTAAVFYLMISMVILGAN